MLNESQAKRKGILCTRLINTVLEFYSARDAPAPMNLLSARYGKALEALGGFPEAIDELRLDGAIDVVLKPSGGRLVYPGGQANRLPKRYALLKV